MKTSFKFGRDTSYMADKNVEFNRAVVKEAEKRSNSLLKNRGYIYLNQIYELLGVKWDVEWENLCTLYNPDKPTEFGIAHEHEDGSLDIDIL